jgi:hypothetical protein
MPPSLRPAEIESKMRAISVEVVGRQLHNRRVEGPLLCVLGVSAFEYAFRQLSGQS